MNIAIKFSSLVRSKIDVSRMILFGSFAKGNFNKDSDIDIAVVLKQDSKENMQLELMRLRRNIDSRIEPHPFLENDFNVSSPLVHEILTHGVEIFE